MFVYGAVTSSTAARLGWGHKGWVGGGAQPRRGPAPPPLHLRCGDHCSRRPGAPEGMRHTIVADSDSIFSTWILEKYFFMCNTRFFASALSGGGRGWRKGQQKCYQDGGHCVLASTSGQSETSDPTGLPGL